VKLTKVERLILANQFRILKESNPQDNHLRRAEVLENGFESLYEEEVFGTIFDSMKEEEGTFVVDVLSMYRGLHDSYLKLKDKGDLTVEDIKFLGFDGNEEDKHFSFTNFFIKDMERFAEIDELCEGYFNSHSAKIPTYRRMLEKWVLIEPVERHEMTIDQIRGLINTH